MVGDPPLYVDHAENAALETQLLEAKASLKAQKLEVADMITELERQGRSLSQRYEQIQMQTEQLRTLPAEIANLQNAIEVLRVQHMPNSEDPTMCLPQPATLQLIQEREAELAALDGRLEAMDKSMAKKTEHMERLEGELRPLEAQKMKAVIAAKEARRRKEEGMNGAEDELEQRARWLRGVHATLSGLLEVRS